MTSPDFPFIHWILRSLTPRESELERRLRIERDKLERITAENRLLRELVQGRAA